MRNFTGNGNVILDLFFRNVWKVGGQNELWHDYFKIYLIIR
jgi:hypothetical protein